MKPLTLKILTMTLLFTLLALTSCSVLGNDKSLPEAPTSTHNSSYVKPPYAPQITNQVTWSSGRSDLKILAMTFDDGPHPQNTPRLLDMLKQRGIKATFFTIGRSVDLYPAIAKRIIDEGHEIGNHTYTHGNLSKMSERGVRKELDKGKEAILRATGVLPRIMRPPYGALYNNQRQWVLDAYGYPTILWSVDPMDWKDRNASIVSNRLISRASPGGILLAHDLHKTTVDAMPTTFDTLLAQGYKFVTVSQLIRLTSQAEQ